MLSPFTIDIETRPVMKMVKYLPDPKVKRTQKDTDETYKTKCDDAVMKQLQGMALNPLTASVITAAVVFDQELVFNGLVGDLSVEFTEFQLLKSL